MNAIALFILLIYFSLHLEEVWTKSGPECDDLLFYSPYVKVKRKRNGGEIDSLERTGFIDLSRQIHVIICINGPAVVLSEYEEVMNGTTLVTNYNNGTMKVYSHECMRVNKIPQDELARLRKANIKIRISTNVKVVGMRAAGVQLVGEAGDYKKTIPAWFQQQNFGHSMRADKIITDGSFAIIGNTKPYCMKVSDEFSVVITSQAKTNEEICVWTILRIDEYYERYETIFRNNRTLPEYEWNDCPSGPPPDPPVPTPAPPHQVHDPFAYIDPNYGKGPPTPSPPPGPPPGPKPDPEILVEYAVNPEICQGFPSIDKTGCTPPPIPDRSCELMNQVTIQDPKVLPDQLRWKNDILNLIAEIFDKVCEPFSPDVPYTVHRILEYYLVMAHEADIALKYRQDLTETWKIIMNDMRICSRKVEKPIWFDWKFREMVDGQYENRRRKRSINSRKQKHHIHTHHHSQKNSYKKRQKPNKKFKEIQKSLRLEPHHLFFNHEPHHHHQTQEIFYNDPMKYEFLEGMPTDITRTKKSSTLTSSSPSISSTLVIIRPYLNQEHLEPKLRHVKYSFLGYPIDTHHVNRTDYFRTQIFYYEDTAEIEYELNVGIDIAWKIWATVAGYCNQHYSTRIAETFPRFYNSYYEEFMEPVLEDWKFPIDNEILIPLLSDVNSETWMKWLDTCLEAAFIDSDTKTFRPPRPLLVKGERATLEKANEFLDLPTDIYEMFHRNQPGDPKSSVAKDTEHNPRYTNVSPK